MRTIASTLGLVSLALALCGCAAGHGDYTRKALEERENKMAGIKAGNEYDQALQAFKAGDMDKARKYVDRSIQINPNVPRSHVLRGRILLEKSELEESAASFQRAEALDPKNVDAQYYLGIVYERFSQDDKALERYRKAAELEPGNAQYAVAAAEMMIDLGQLDEARSFLTERSDSFEHNAGVRQTLGHIAMLQGDSDTACRMFDEARLLAPDDVNVLEDLLHAQMATGKWAEAEYNITRLMKAPGNAERRDLRHMRVQCLLSVDRPVEAREMLLDLTRDDAGQKDVEAWILLGNTSYVLHDMNRVRMAWTRAIALAPSRHEGYLLRALWQRKQGEMDAALASVNKAIEHRGHNTEPLMLKAMLLREMGRHAEARQTFSTILAEDPDNKIAQQALSAAPVE